MQQTICKTINRIGRRTPIVHVDDVVDFNVIFGGSHLTEVSHTSLNRYLRSYPYHLAQSRIRVYRIDHELQETLAIARRYL